MSTDRQEASIPDQQEWARRRCPQENVEVVREFQDAAVPGSEIRGRSGLADLVDYCEAQADRGRPVDAVVCWDTDRFSRADSFRTAAVLGRLLDAGTTRMLTTAGWIDFTQDTDRIIFNLKQDSSNAAFSRKLSGAITRNFAGAAPQGKWLTTPPYAYRIGPDGHLELASAVEVEAVRYIFRRYLDSDDSARTIAAWLEERGFPSPSVAQLSKRKKKGLGKRRPQPWNRQNVLSILMNPAYQGDVVYNVTSKGKYTQIRGGVPTPGPDRQALKNRLRLKSLPAEKNSPDEWLVSANAHPALVDRKTFEAAQRKRAASFRKRRTDPRDPEPWLLSGLLFCGHCGAVMWGQKMNRRRGEKEYQYRRYVCSTSKRHGKGGCHLNAVGPDTVLGEVVKLIEDRFANPQALAALTAEAEWLARADREDFQKRLDAVRGQLAELDRQIAAGNRNLALLPEDRLPAVIAQVRDWEAQRKRLASELDLLECSGDERDDAAQKAAAAVEQLQHLEACLREAEPSEAKGVLQSLIRKVTLHFHHEDEPGGRQCNRSTVLESLDVEFHPDLLLLLCPAGRRRASAGAESSPRPARRP
jgi:DNA invertase Pin-like site-specific DNA recombinase